MRVRAALELLVPEWSALEPRTALRFLPCIAVLLGVGLACRHPAAGMIAASGAASVGFGVFQRIGKSAIAPMLLAAVGMSVSTLMGTVAGFSPLILALMAAVWGFLYGLLTALGSGASWVGQQSVIALLVVSAYPVSVGFASTRAALILAGGLLQTVCILALRSIERLHHADPVILPSKFWRREFLPAVRTLNSNLSPHTEAFRYGLRLAVALAITAGLARLLSVQHGYWVPMTTVLVLKPGADQIYVRGVARVAGTLVGAALATLIAALVRPLPATIAILVLIFAWLSYTFHSTNYATFTICITIYVVFLLGLVGLPELVTVEYRALDTIIGGVFALILYRVWPM